MNDLLDHLAVSGRGMTPAAATQLALAAVLPALPAVPPTDPPATDGDNHEPPWEKVTVNLRPKAYRALAWLVRISGFNKSIVVNRALVVLAEIEETIAKGGHIVGVDPNGNTKALRGL